MNRFLLSMVEVERKLEGSRNQVKRKLTESWKKAKRKLKDACDKSYKKFKKIGMRVVRMSWKIVIDWKEKLSDVVGKFEQKL